jgi:leucyl aminopeptidase (aminopeptidase T)
MISGAEQVRLPVRFAQGGPVLTEEQLSEQELRMMHDGLNSDLQHNAREQSAALTATLLRQLTDGLDQEVEAREAADRAAEQRAAEEERAEHERLEAEQAARDEAQAEQVRLLREEAEHREAQRVAAEAAHKVQQAAELKAQQAAISRCELELRSVQHQLNTVGQAPQLHPQVSQALTGLLSTAQQTAELLKAQSELLRVTVKPKNAVAEEWAFEVHRNGDKLMSSITARRTK